MSGQAARARRDAAGARPDGTIDINAAMRPMLEELLNAVMGEQASELSALRNGYRERGLGTHVGTVTLRMPKLREGSYSPTTSCAVGRTPTPRSPRRYATCCFRSPRPGRSRRPEAETTRGDVQFLSQIEGGVTESGAR